MLLEMGKMSIVFASHNNKLITTTFFVRDCCGVPTRFKSKQYPNPRYTFSHKNPFKNVRKILFYLSF